MPNHERDSYQTNQQSTRVSEQFFGALLKTNPDALENINPRNQHILLSHSDSVTNSDFQELSTTFGISEQTVKEIYVNNLIHAWDKAPGELQRQFPLLEIFKSQELKMRRSARKVQTKHQRTPSIKINLFLDSLKEFLDRYETDSVFRGEIDAVVIEYQNKISQARGSRKSSKPDLTRIRKKSEAVIQNEDRDLWAYAVNNDLITVIYSRGLMSSEELSILTKFFEEKACLIHRSQLEKLLDRFSILIAQLA